ncbi:MAG: hypothetical protein NZ789_21615, partial [Pseudomonadales bacterium]|nr:hypothetical protein [Pseudomonadales bacterium]
SLMRNYGKGEARIDQIFSEAMPHQPDTDQADFRQTYAGIRRVHSGEIFCYRSTENITCRRMLNKWGDEHSRKLFVDFLLPIAAV